MSNKELVYIHLHASERFVISSGITFEDFYLSLEKPLQNILLLKHHYKDAQYNMDTMLEYVYQEDVGDLVKHHGDESGDFCWIDFEEESALSELEGQQLAELLYLGHCKQHLRPPFYRLLNNNFVYLSNDDGLWNKVYYRSLYDFYFMVGRLIPEKIATLKVEKTWLGLRKKADYPPVSIDILERLSSLMAEGLMISFERISQTRNRLEIPLWLIGDCSDMEEAEDIYKEQRVVEPDAKIIFAKKTREWALVLQ
ncbi:hypothetical protein [Bacillus testis]|uniref:hypothetical protein n=1 Tax=Bacillus testis TaxID=1622072 RepID=UPI00067EB720|nr:hypothetical protein [Bacillus testis]